MLIYRIECSKCGCGPYTCCCDHWQDGTLDLKSKHNTDFFLRTKPGMLMDIPHMTESMELERWFCGFLSHEQLDTWFDEEDQQIFKDNGFNLVEYHSNDFLVGRSGTQVFFMRDG